ncbi:tail chaperonin [Cytobacillus horneckiae]|uniref:tail chaperonin n=1 Tax=Cytobacillus horneckiae TaxID=549687 RepID=UPI0034CF5380
MLIDPSLLEDKNDELPIEFENYEDEVVFKEQLRIWHSQYGSIFCTEINEVLFFFRSLTKKEMDIAQKVYEDDYERTEYICKTCVIEPSIDDYSLDIYAGVPEILCNTILEESGYINAQKIKIMIAKWEKHMENVDNQLPLVIKEAFQELSLEEIESWPMEKISEYYVKAKWLLENLRGMSLVSNENEMQEG